MADSPSPRLEPYVVLRGLGRLPWYRRRIPESLRPVMGASTVTVRLAGHPHGNVAERRQYLAAYARVHGETEQRLETAARGQRRLSAAEQLGVAGHWVSAAPARPADGTDAIEAAAVLRALLDLGLDVDEPIRNGWQPDLSGAPTAAVTTAASVLALRLQELEHPCRLPWPPGDLVWGGPDSVRAEAWLSETLAAAVPLIKVWQQRARGELQRLGVLVPAAEVLPVAARLATAAAALSAQQQQLEAGEIPQPLAFPPPPQPTTPAATFQSALQRWLTLRAPTAKTVADASARLLELAAHAGHNRLEALTADQAGAWRDALLEDLAPATVKRRVALVKAVLAAAADDGLPVAPGVIERLRVSKVRQAGGTTAQRRAFTASEAATLIRASRSITSARPLDRWGFPLGLATGARLEELAGLRPHDVRQIDGVWAVVIEPHDLRRLKNNNSARSVPVPAALIAEGFVTWAQQQSGALLFPEPEPPAADPRLSHYASIRLGKILRAAGISDRTAVFHSCRHFAAQSLLDAGIEQRQIEAITGHSSRSMVAGYSRAGVPLPLLAAAQSQRDWDWWPRPELDAMP